MECSSLQDGLISPRGYSLDYRHYFITSPRGWRMSSKFRKETYTVGDMTLVALVGDEREAVVLVDDEDDIDTLSFNSNSWPRLRRSAKNPTMPLLYDHFDEAPGIYSDSMDSSGMLVNNILDSFNFGVDGIMDPSPSLDLVRSRDRDLYGKS